MYWNWQKVPETEHAELIAHIEAARWGEVAKVCERYGVSEYCCCNPEGLQSWARWAIEQGILKRDGHTTGAGLAENTGRDGGAIVGQTA